MKEACCPYCGRWLVRLDDDGKLDVAAQSELQFNFDLNALKIKRLMVEGGHLDADGTPNFETARCLRLLCRIRRWYKHD